MRRVFVIAVAVIALVAVAVPASATSQFRFELAGSNEVGGGDPDGTGSARIELSQNGTVCFDLHVSGIETPTAAHIHVGEAGVNGGVVVSLAIDVNGLSGCVDGDPTVVAAINADPAGYYVNVHNAEFPGGAVRGQLG